MQLQRALSCVTDAVVFPQVYPSAGPTRVFVLSQDPARLHSPNRFGLSVSLQFAIVADGTNRSLWHIATGGYMYSLHDAANRELFAYHWHPESRSPITFPHIHMIHSGEVGIPQLGKAHFPTGQVSLQDVLRLIIRDFEVEPQREDWERVLAEAEMAVEK